jgi:hypothetical protein
VRNFAPMVICEEEVRDLVPSGVTLTASSVSNGPTPAASFLLKASSNFAANAPICWAIKRIFIVSNRGGKPICRPTTRYGLCFLVTHM